MSIQTAMEDTPMGAIVLLFLLAFLVGIRSDTHDFKFLAALLLLIFASIAAMWQSINNWPGVFSPAFAAAVISWVFTMFIGLTIGGLSRKFITKD